MLLNKRELMGKQFIFLNDPDNLYIELNQVFNIDLNDVNCENLKRYCTKLFYDHEISVDYKKQIKIILEKFLGKQITEEDLKDIEEIKADETRRIEEAKRQEKPKFSWDLNLSNKNKEGK